MYLFSRIGMNVSWSQISKLFGKRSNTGYDIAKVATHSAIGYLSDNYPTRWCDCHNSDNTLGLVRQRRTLTINHVLWSEYNNLSQDSASLDFSQSRGLSCPTKELFRTHKVWQSRVSQHSLSFPSSNPFPDTQLTISSAPNSWGGGGGRGFWSGASPVPFSTIH